MDEGRRGYRFCRGLVRLWFALSFHKIRLLGGEKLPESGPTLLAVGHPASFLDALILVTALDRPVSCLIPRRFIRGFWLGRWAQWLGMMTYELADETGRPVPPAGCVDALAREGVVAVFADPPLRDSTCRGEKEFALTAASIAAEAEGRLSRAGGMGLVMLPVHLYLPVKQPQSSELLVYIDSPLLPQEHPIPGSPAGAESSQARGIGELLESRWRENPFRLQAEDVKRFAADLEEVLRANLEDDWASRANWKQKVDGFQLSGFAAAWAEQANYLHPGRLVALREALEAYRESRRRGALREAEVEVAHAGHAGAGSLLQQGWVWFESLAGLPVALYGLVNHLLVLLILFWAGLLKHENDRDLSAEWLIRGTVLVGCYVGQILMVTYLLGRSVAAASSDARRTSGPASPWASPKTSSPAPEVRRRVR